MTCAVCLFKNKIDCSVLKLFVPLVGKCSFSFLKYAIDWVIVSITKQIIFLLKNWKVCLYELLTSVSLCVSEFHRGSQRYRVHRVLFLTNNLSVVFEIDSPVFIPTNIRHTFLIKGFKPIEFGIKMSRRTQHDFLVADERHKQNIAH